MESTRRLTFVTISSIGRAVLAIAVLACPPSPADAQRWDGGVKSGVTRSALTDSREFEWNRAPTSAAFIKRPIGGPFWIQPELSYVRRMGVSRVAASVLTLTADYVELPLLLQLQLVEAMGIAPFVFAGPSVSFRLRCRLQFVGGGVRSNEDCDEARDARSNPFDVGAGAGAGIGWTIGNVTLSVESRVTAGLRTNVLPTEAKNGRSIGWSALAGVSMPLYRVRTMPPVRLPTIVVLPPEPVPSPARVAAEARTSSGSASERRITLTADDVDVREVLLGIAQVAGLNIVVSTQIRKRVSAALFSVPAEEAIKAIADVAGLSVMRASEPGQATIVFLQPAVNINEAPAATILERFGVSGDMARWIAENRTPSPPTPRAPGSARP